MVVLSYLGKAEFYPFQPDGQGGVKLIEGLENVKQSTLNLLGTTKGSITFRESYGCDAELLQYETNDDILSSLLVFFITDAIFEFEKRIQVTSVSIVMGVDVAQCYVFYDIPQANRSGNLVFPFERKIAA